VGTRVWSQGFVRLALRGVGFGSRGVSRSSSAVSNQCVHRAFPYSEYG